MRAILGPVVATQGGYMFERWTPGEGLGRSFVYRCVEHAHYARARDIAASRGGQMLACETADDFAGAIACLRDPAQAASISQD